MCKNFLIRSYDLLSRGPELFTRSHDLLSRGHDLLTLSRDLLSRVLPNLLNVFCFEYFLEQYMMP